MRVICQFENNIGELDAISSSVREGNPVIKYLAKYLIPRSATYKELTVRSRSLTALLRSCTEFQATDERDQIYGLLGIAVDGSDFIPDYSQPVLDVYANVTKHIITNTKSLEILQSAGTGMIKRRAGLPSWVPDFAFLTYGPAAQHCKVGFKAGISRFSGPGAPYQIFGNRISFQGVIVDKIDFLGTVKFDLDGAWYQWLIEATELSSVTYSANIDPFEILWRTLIANYIDAPDSCTYPAPNGYSTAFTHFQTIYLNPAFKGLNFKEASAHVENDSTILPLHK